MFAQKARDALKNVTFQFLIKKVQKRASEKAKKKDWAILHMLWASCKWIQAYLFRKSKQNIKHAFTNLMKSTLIFVQGVVNPLELLYLCLLPEKQAE